MSSDGSLWSYDGIASQRPGDALDSVNSIACVTASLCVEGWPSGTVSWSSQPSPPETWTPQTVDPAGAGALNCSSDGLCLEESASQAYAIHAGFSSVSAPAGFDWVTADVSNPQYAASCVAGTTACATVDDLGNVAITQDGSKGASAVWTVTPAAAEPLYAVSCPTRTECVAGDAGGDILVSSNPFDTTPIWRSTNVDGSHAIVDVSCSSASACTAVDDGGNAVTNTNVGTSAWTVAPADSASSVAVNSVSCPVGEPFCVGVDDQGGVTGFGMFPHTSADPTHSLQAVSCAGANLCVAGDDAGNLATTTSPQSGVWTVSPLSTFSLDAISCSSPQMCVAGDDSGSTFNSISPTTSAADWTSSATGTNAPVYGLSCPGASGCELVNSAGRAIWGWSTTSSLTDPTISGTPVAGGSLVVNPGTWSDPATTFLYEWDDCDSEGNCTAIAGADKPTYSPTTADIGWQLIAVVAGVSNGRLGAVVAAGPTSTVTGPAPAAPVAPSNTAPTAIAGAPAVGSKPLCGGKTGAALANCQAALTRTQALAVCKVLKKTRQRARCIATANRTYRRAVAAIKCRAIKNGSKRAVCLARARRLK